MEKQRYFISGMTGLVGTELYKKLSKNNYIIGCSRKKPSWWNNKDHFIEVNFLNDDIDFCSNHIDESTTVIHLLNVIKNGAEIDKKISKSLFEISKAKAAKKFIYTSSIRVYGDNFGTVDENTAPVPGVNDAYGQAKLDTENALRDSNNSNIQLIICRLGSVFSEKTKNKIPRKLRRFGRLIHLGENTHLISVANVVSAIDHILSTNFDKRTYLYNITQEEDDNNNYIYLGDALTDCGVSKNSYIPSSIGKKIRHRFFKMRGTSHTGPFVKVVEQNLLSDGFTYEASLLQSLRQINRRRNGAP